MNRFETKKFRPANVLIILVLIVSMVACYSAWGLTPFSGQSSAVYADTYRGTDVSSPSSDCVLAYVECNFISSPKDTVLAKINAIRYEACSQGMLDPRNSSRRLTLSDYRPVDWSYTLEWMAQIRACEVGLYRSHTRPSGKFSYGSMKLNGVTTLNEVLAWKGGADVMTGINMWYSEKSSWASGSWSGTSHYRAIINPNYTHVGFAGFPGGWNTIAGEFTTASGLDTSQVDSTDTIFQAIELKQGNITSFSVNPTLTLNNGKAASPGFWGSVSYTNSLTIYPISAFTSTSSNASVATADSQGYVTAKSCGTTDITFTFAGRSDTCTVTSNYSTTAPSVLIKRIYGHDRYDTAMTAAREYMKLAGKTSLPGVVIANGDKFPDALSGGAISVENGFPTLLTSNAQYVQDKVASFVTSNVDSGGMIYLLGGTNAVSEAFETKMADVVMGALRKCVEEIGDREMVVQIVKKMMRAVIRTQKHVTLKVAPGMVESVKARREEIRSPYPTVETADVVEDARLKGTAAILETEAGVADASVDTQLAAIEKSIRRHVSGGGAA